MTVTTEISDIERHARTALAELGVHVPSTELLRAQMMLEHSKNASELAHGLAVQPDPFGHAEETACELRNRLLHAAPMGGAAGVNLGTMAQDAAAELGKSTNVHVESAAPFSSRYVQFLLRTDDEGKNAYQHGIAVVVAVYANDKMHTFPRPILVAAGDGLGDPRRPYDYRELVRALHAAGLRTNDYTDASAAAAE